MYYSFREKQQVRKKPFHQKVLHFQYDVPLSQVKNLFDFFVATTEGNLLMAEDSSAVVKEYFAYNKDIWTPFNDERKTYGVFDECGTFYVRLEIDSMSNTQRSEDVCGNIFLFAEETILSNVGNHFKDGCGQLVIEGAADYFALLED